VIIERALLRSDHGVPMTLGRERNVLRRQRDGTGRMDRFYEHHPTESLWTRRLSNQKGRAVRATVSVP